MWPREMQVRDVSKMIYKRKKRKSTARNSGSEARSETETATASTSKRRTTKHAGQISFGASKLALILAILICDNRTLAEQSADSGQQQPETNKWQPRFLEEPRDTVVLAGQPVDLACRIEHKRGILSWLRNGIAIGTETIYEPYADNYRLPGAPEDQRAPDEPSSEPANYSLHINAATLLEDASFQCALRRKSSALDAPNQFKPIASHSARLSVLQPPRELQIQASILAEPDQQEVPLDWLSPSSAEEAPDIKRIPVRHGQRIRLECRADQSKPHAELIWLDHEQARVPKGPADAPNGSYVEELIQASEEQPKLARASLSWTFTVNRQLHSDRPLTCLARHQAFNERAAIPQLFGRELRRQLQLEVQFAPQVELSRDQQKAYEHQPIRFRCQAEARPHELAYRWFIDDQLIENATESELLIARLTRQLHLREIHCEASNSVGTGRGSLRLAVHYAPAFASHLLPASLQPTPVAFEPGEPASAANWLALGHQLAQSFEEGQDVTLRCDFDSHPRLQQVHWFKVGSDFNTMANVSSEEADALIAGGAVHAALRHQFGARSALGPDFELMSSELLAEVATFDRATRDQIVQPLASEQLAHTSARIYEPLDWRLRPAPSPRPFRRHAPSGAAGNASQVARREVPRLAAAGEQEPAPNESLSWRAPDESERLELELLSAAPNARFLRREAQLSSSVVLVPRAGPESVGRYVCKARLADASASLARSIFLVMRRPPRLVSVQEQYAPLGASQLRLDCLAQINMVVDNATSFTWSKDGKLIESVSNESGSQRSVVISSQRSPDLLFMRSQLTINQAQLSDFGTYKCTIKNSIDSDSILISLRLSAPTGRAFAYMATLLIGVVFFFACFVAFLIAFASAKPKPLKTPTEPSIAASARAPDEAGEERKLGPPDAVTRSIIVRLQLEREQQVAAECSSDSASTCDQSRLAKRPRRNSAASDKFAAIHQSLEHKLQLDPSARKPRKAPNQASLARRLWTRLFGASPTPAEKPADGAGKSRPSISLPVSVSSQRAALKRSSISTSLTALGLPAPDLQDCRLTSLGCAGPNGQSFRHPTGHLVSSSANLIQDSATGSDRSASSQSSESSRLNCPPVETAGQPSPGYGVHQPQSNYIVQPLQLANNWCPSDGGGSFRQQQQQLYQSLHEPTGGPACDYGLFVSEQQSSYQVAGQPMEPSFAPANSPLYHQHPQQIYSNHLPTYELQQHQQQQQFADYIVSNETNSLIL